MIADEILGKVQWARKNTNITCSRSLKSSEQRSRASIGPRTGLRASGAQWPIASPLAAAGDRSSDRMGGVQRTIDRAAFARDFNGETRLCFVGIGIV